MAKGDDDLILSHLFVAAPELMWDEIFLDYLKTRGMITDEGLDAIRKFTRAKTRLETVRRKIKGKTLFGRVVAIAPEIVNRRLINVLEGAKKITPKEASQARILVGIVERGSKGGLPKDMSAVLRRARGIFGLGLADDMIGFLRSAEYVTAKQATTIRGGLLGGQVAGEKLAAMIRAKTLFEALQLAGSGLVDRRTIDALRMTGLIDGRTSRALLEAVSYGTAEWKVWEGAKRVDGLAARFAYVVSGSFSWEALEFLTAIKQLTPAQKGILQIAVSMSQTFNRELMERATDRKFRVRPGEAPIVSYARAAKETDRALLKLLAEASDKASKEAASIARAGKPGKAMRAAEYNLRARGLHQAMRQVWEGTGYLTIFGEAQVASTAVSSSEALMARYSRHLPDQVQRMLEYQARSGLDSYISRKENTLPLSRRVYGNLNLWSGKVDKTISLGLLQGKSAKEIADSVRHLIDPKVNGGVRYAAMRLGRTELGNAFHYTTIRHSREMPWVRGYKWNRSSSHPRPDVCDDMAEDDHDDLGPGVYKKSSVPGKPHPHCLCYVTVVMMDEEQFIRGMNAGRFNSYMNSRVATLEPDEKSRFPLPDQFKTKAVSIATQLAVSRIVG